MNLPFNKKYESVIIAALIALTVFIIFALSIRHWGFLANDGGLIWGAKTDNFFDFFIGHDLGYYGESLYSKTQTITFFNADYRPLNLAFYKIQEPFFGGWAYGYFLVILLIHALSSSLFYIILRTFFPISISVCGALYFAFHNSLCSYFGWIAAQCYFVALLFLLLSITLFFRAMQRKSILVYFISVISYLIALFSFEIVIAFPIILLLIFFTKTEIEKLTALRFTTFGKYFALLIPFGLVNLIFLGLRLYNFPLQISLTSNDPTMIKFAAFTYDLYGYISNIAAEFLNTSLIPSGYFFIKCALSIIILASLLFLFFKSQYKKLIIFFLLSGSLLMWPILRSCQNRYFYCTLPFLILSFFILLIPLFSRYHKTLLTAIFGVTLLNACNLITNLQEEGKQLDAYLKSTIELASNPQVKDRILCFLCSPGYKYKFGDGWTECCWLCGLNPGKIMSLNFATIVDGTSSPDKDNIKITQISDGFICEIINPEIWFRRTPLGVGAQDECEYNTKKQIIKTKLKFSKKLIDKNHLFVVWSHKINKFQVIGNNEKVLII